MGRLNNIFITKDNLIPLYSSSEISLKRNTPKGLEELEMAGLLPLKPSTNPTFLLFVKILGFRYADGCIYQQKRNNSFTFSLTMKDYVDAENICNEIYKIWNLELNPHKTENKYAISI